MKYVLCACSVCKRIGGSLSEQGRQDLQSPEACIPEGWWGKKDSKPVKISKKNVDSDKCRYAIKKIRRPVCVEDM